MKMSFFRKIFPCSASRKEQADSAGGAAGGSDKSSIFSRFSLFKRKTKLCRVKLLDGSESEIEVNEKSKGSELFEKVCEVVYLREKHFFGLSFCTTDEDKVWLDLNRKIKKQMGHEPWIFSFEVKFYPTNPDELQDENTRYYMCLQIRKDILSGKLRCSPILLASYLAQSYFGDYDSEKHNDDYLSEFQFMRNQTPDEEKKVMEQHKQHKGQTPAEAEMNYLKTAKKLKMYGVSMHDVKDPRNFSTMIGVCSSGLQVYKPGRNKLSFQRHDWRDIVEIKVKRNKFSFELLRDGEALPRAIFEFTLSNDAAAKRLWTTTIEYYSFYRLKNPKSIPKSKWKMFRRKYRGGFKGPTEYQIRKSYPLPERTFSEFERKY